MDRYEHVIAYFHDHGFATVAYDRRGHGRSEGPKGHCPSYALLQEEVKTLLQQTEARYPEHPIFLYGHSMGGNLVLNYLISNQAKLAGTIATGPWIKLGQSPPALLLAFARLINNIFPGYTQGNGLDASHISRIEDEVQKYKNDPLVHDRVSARMGIEMLEASKVLEAFRGVLSCPVLLQHGGGDQITNPQATSDFASRITSAVDLKIWDDLYHEIHNENIREQIFDYTIDWMNKILEKNAS